MSELLWEHELWKGDLFKDGIESQRLMLFGFSHYGSYENGSDDANFTNYAIKRWALKGELPFFNRIAGYFGFTDVSAFLHRVAFANALPRSVGDEEDKFSAGDERSQAAVPDRVRRLLHEVNADKAIIFSKKAWTLFPLYDDRQDDGVLEVEGYSPINFGGYRRSEGGFTQAYGLRHTIAARWDMMHASVQAILTHEPGGGS